MELGKESSESMKGKLYRWFMVQPQSLEILNFYKQSLSLSNDEKERSVAELEKLGPKVSIKDKSAARQRVHFYTRYPSYLRENTYLMFFSYIEEFLSSTYTYKTNNPIASNSHGIQRFIDPYNSIGIEIAGISNWEFLTKCQLIRNGLLHANGRISLLKNRSEIETILDDKKWSSYFSKRTGLFKVMVKDKNESEYLNIEEICLEQLSKTQRELECKIFEENQI